MIFAASWLMTYFFHGIIGGAIAAGVRFFPASAAARCRVWRFAILSPFATASIAIAANDTHALSVSPVVAAGVASKQRQTLDVQMIRRSGATPVQIETRTDPLAATTSLIVVVCAAVASCAGVLRLAIQRTRVSRRLSFRVSCDAGHGLVGSTSMSEWLQVPIALSGGEICVPSSFTRLGVSEQRSVLLHERAHVTRKDPEWLETARAIAAVLWWQPLNVFLTRRLERDSELAADELAMASGADGPSLVRALAEFAATLEDRSVAGAALVQPESPLIERARLILDGAHHSRWTPFSCLVIASLTALLAFAPRVTAERPLATAPYAAKEVVEETSVILR